MGNEREDLRNTLIEGAKQTDAVLALWESGSICFDRADDYSDIDLSAVVEPGHVEIVARSLRSAVEAVAPIAHEYRQPTHGAGQQFFWQFEGVSPFLFIDLDVLERQPDALVIDPSTHGDVRVHFDRIGCLRLEEENSKARRARVLDSVARIAAVAPLQPLLVKKHLLRGHALHAFGTYQRWIVQPLIELLRFKHCPERSSFGTTYLEWDLPPQVLERLEPLMLATGTQEIEDALPQAAAWLDSLVGELRDQP